ncbi:MAG: ATP-binding cassette domain-containing protein [Terrimicrobiaceae bacterium]|nr:ATP-binding cassette domain-containing protein [Terrimicrobiaceae bacterium]
MHPILSVENLTIRRGAAHLVRGIDWEVRAGEHWVILGANGSGKTSLLRALGGYLAPSEGGVRLLGETFGETDWRELRSRLGFVSASIAQLLHDEDTALEIVAGGRQAMAGYWGPLSADDRNRARRLLADLSAPDLAEKPWQILSQGERQRVLIARALMARPRLLLLDEPCAGLDPVARERFLALVHRLGSRRNAVPLVLVTHHVEEILPVFTHALILQRGRLLAAGPLRDVVTQPILATAFETPLHLIRRKGRYRIAPIVRED